MKYEVKRLIDSQTFIKYLYDVDHDFGIPISEKNTIELFACKLLTNGNVYVVEENCEIVSCIGFYCNDVVNNNAYLPILSTKKIARGKGYARLLIHKMIEVCKNNDMKIIYCDSINPRAVALYKSIGFVEYDKIDNKTFLKYTII